MEVHYETMSHGKSTFSTNDKYHPSDPFRGFPDLSDGAALFAQDIIIEADEAR